MRVETPFYAVDLQIETPGKHRHMKILVADDSRISQTIISAILKKWGYDPVLAAEGHTALDILRGPEAPKIAILDWNMPGMDGVEVCRRLRELSTSDPPYIIMVTSRGEKKDIVSGLEAGANDYIIKPFDNAELLARIKVGHRMTELQSELNKAKDALAYEAHHDPLTSALNRRAILTALERELSRARRESSILAIGLFDIDHFKRINDTFGHQVGDDVLRGLVKLLGNNLRDYDYLGRYGGEEFLIITPGQKSAPKDSGLYGRLCQLVASNKVESKAGTLSVTVSIGVATGARESTVNTIIEAADSALYKAKNDGRNRVAYAD